MLKVESLQRINQILQQEHDRLYDLFMDPGEDSDARGQAGIDKEVVHQLMCEVSQEILSGQPKESAQPILQDVSRYLGLPLKCTDYLLFGGPPAIDEPWKSYERAYTHACKDKNLDPSSDTFMTELMERGIISRGQLEYFLNNLC